MKTIITMLIMVAVSTWSLFAQTPDNTINKEQMNKFSSWVGTWKGEGSMQMGPGEPKKSTVDEKVDLKLDGTILVVEGIGKTIDAATKKELIVHNAYGVLSYDVTSKSYKFKTYLKDGRSMDAWFNVISEGQYEWGFDIPGGAGKVKYSITIDANKKTWKEIGEFSPNTNTWMKFFEMNLVKA